VDEAVRTPPGVLPTDLTHPRFHLRSGLVRARPRAVRAVDQPGQPVRGIPGAPGVHRLARDPELGGDVGLRLTALHSQHGAVALLDNGHVHQGQSRPPTHAVHQDDT